MDNKDLNNKIDSTEEQNTSTSLNEEASETTQAPVQEETPKLAEQPQTEVTPVINIPESNEKKEEVKSQNQTLNTNADFSSIFGVASEEKPVEENKPVKEVPKEELAPEVKVTEQPNPEKQPAKFNKDLFNNEEKILYEIKPEKEGNPLVVVFFFIFLVVFIIFLPSIVKVANFKSNTGGNTPTTKQEEESDIYELGSTAVRVKLDNLEFNNFVKISDNDELYINFTLTNTASQPYMFDKKYYITLYDEETIVGYALIHSYDIVSAYGSYEAQVVVNENTYRRANHFKVEEIVPSRYPNKVTTEVDGDYNVLTCTHLNDEIKYYFNNSSLVKITETYKETLEGNKNYSTDKENYRNLSEKYKQIDHFNSTFVETNTDFTMLNDIDLKDIPDKTLTDLKVYRYFRYSEQLNNIAFEIEAQGYTCR